MDKARKGYLSLYSKRSKKILTAKKLVDDMYLQGNIIPVTARRIPHNMDGNDIILGSRAKHLVGWLSAIIHSGTGGVKAEVSCMV